MKKEINFAIALMYYIIITLLRRQTKPITYKFINIFKIVSKTYDLYSKSYIIYFSQPKLVLTVVSVVAKDFLWENTQNLLFVTSIMTLVEH